MSGRLLDGAPYNQPTMERAARQGRATGWGSAAARWSLPLAASLAAVAIGPFLGELRVRLVEAFGRRFFAALALGLAAVALGAGAVAVGRLRRWGRRGLPARLAGLALAAVLVVLQVIWWRTGDANVDLFQRVHLPEYALLAVLYLLAFRSRHRGIVLPVLTLAAVTLVGLADEAVQWATPVRVGDGRDVLLNLYAGVVGVIFGLSLVPRPVLGGPSAPATRRAAAWLCAGVVLAGAAFFDVAHLGHRIDDPEVGSFVSYFSPRSLERAREERARRWAVDPPRPPRPLAFEDYFLTEAGWHAQARNEALSGEDFERAFEENRILERWYTPYLDLGRRHRWPPAQRAYVERHREPFESATLSGRIVTRPRGPVLWSGVGALVLALGITGWRLGRGGADV
jgi:VanZ family protein